MRKQLEGKIWIQEKAPAGNWVNSTGFPTGNSGGRDAAIGQAVTHADWLRKNLRKDVRIVEMSYVILQDSKATL
jgi:hypothetical protein